MRNKKTELTYKFAAVIRIERARKNITQETLAELANISVQSISAIENNTATPSIETANDFARAFGMTLSELFQEVEKIKL